ncbi:adhesion G protein-coupled receptor G3-like [Anguilla anguilla]|uniref:adhesion G protein-coupled receptor G3-like n=1 Tax=Anguilla anguilla TaxID=7936 RepID=UPI0015AEB391|nr:adhesion G protein-coupled receptor G3-like [Anguilla anguilla]
MESNQSSGVLKLALILVLLGQGASQMMSDFEMCGTWNHGTSGNLWFDVSTGCGTVTVAANETTLSIQGSIMGTCKNSSTIPLTLGEGEIRFCVYWEPLLDLLQVKVGERIHTLCKTAALQKSCCSSLSRKGNTNASGTFGISNGSIKGDVIEGRLQESYTFFGEREDCYKDLCAEHHAQLIEQLALRSGVIGQVDLPCAHVSTKKLEKGFQGFKVDIQAPEKNPLRNEPPPVSVWLPASLVPSEEGGATVVFTYYAENTLFQGPEDRILDGVVGISVENRVIASLPDPVKIVFHHGPVAKNESTKCVFWDTKKDPTNVTWRDEGCNTIRRQEETECRCDHLTYFAILVELNPGSPVDDLEALTYITSVCCAISLCSCVALIILHTKALRVTKEESLIPIHRNLAVALLLLCTLFMLTGVLANVAGEGMCRAVGAALHYALLCSFAWMAIEVFAAFWLICQVMNNLPRLRVLNALGFGLPALLVVVFVCINDVYGTRAITPSDDVSSPYKMCWIKDTWRGNLIHFITNVSFSVAVVFAGLVMLSLVLWMLLTRKEWGRTWSTFLSIWGLSCLFGCTWGLGLLLLAPPSRVATFLFCIINSLQGFLLLVRYFMLEWIKKRKSDKEHQSTGSSVCPMIPQGSKTQDQGSRQDLEIHPAPNSTGARTDLEIHLDPE